MKGCQNATRHPLSKAKKAVNTGFKVIGYFLSFFQVDFEQNLPNVLANRTDDTSKNDINRENKCHFPGYNPEEKSYTNTSRESRL